MSKQPRDYFVYGRLFGAMRWLTAVSSFASFEITRAKLAPAKG
ncbi:MAG: hypothetical protein R3E31_26215 [Chloroflexota bacterium]